MPELKKHDLLRLLEELNFFYCDADFIQLKNLLQQLIGLMLKYFRLNEIDAALFKSLSDYIALENAKPPHGAPIDPAHTAVLGILKDPKYNML